MLFRVLRRLAAVLLTLMYVIFGVLVHLPSIIASPSSHDNWAENAINLLLIGAAWSLADLQRWGHKAKLRPEEFVGAQISD